MNLEFQSNFIYKLLVQEWGEQTYKMGGQHFFQEMGESQFFFKKGGVIFFNGRGWRWKSEKMRGKEMKMRGLRVVLAPSLSTRKW